ncbi:helix-turn-helix transcriptional regulator [Wenxinia saemankumensis]|uniref:Autoinducer binding domain-containing protein n=1 Tax=Wenxinia saemankumensis TaxID=1447782 RepID=A0A1M6EJ69_9RHOB|nr:LuxR family transcriptional regulator [Wenxinia saemankumensis]SHI85380.1 Autoinducer binding domain-containing protein [Wenxinia saemankumensis]
MSGGGRVPVQQPEPIGAAAIDTAPDAETAWEATLGAFAAAGFPKVIYITADRGRRDVATLTNIPELYDGVDPAQDPFLEWCCHSYEITRTGPAYLQDYDYLPAAARDFIRRAARTGFTSGFAVPVRLAESTRYGGFNVGCDLGRAAFEAAWPAPPESVRLIALVAHRRLEELGAGQRPDPSRPPSTPSALAALSPRERELAILLARGLSRKDCARDCGLSVHTVNDYVKSLYRKLGVSNRIELVNLLRQP